MTSSAPSDADPLGAALAHLPHGREFRFLDRLTALEPGKRAEGEYRVRGDEEFLRGHFPGTPLFPGVLLIEAAAQLAGVTAQTDPEYPPLPNLKLTAVRQAKILGSVSPGELIRLDARVLARMELLVQASVTCWSGEKLLLKTEVTLSGGRGE